MMPAIDFDIDESARAEALDVTRSFIVKAPAGSGKTQLLTLRLLALLAKVEEPGEILAITFTKAATAEMRGRVLSALLRADAGTQMDEPESTLARAALEHAKKRGWSLLAQPHLLNIQTIDSLCLQIAHGAPLLSRLGGQLQPTEDAKALYQLAASRTLEKLAVDSSALSNALKHLLVLRDVNLGDCETLIANMLENRDLWLGEFANARSLNEEDWAKLRERLEEPFRREHTRVLRNVKGLLDGARGRQLLALAAHACGNNPTVQIHNLGSIASFEDLTHIDHYRCILEFVLTKQRDWRKKPDARLGFPTEKQGGSAHHKAAFEALLLELTTIDGLREALCAVDGLPAERFTDEQWQTILSIFTVLLHAAAELRVVFAEKSTIDFVELGLTAEFALKDTEHQRLFSGTVRHLLVDEFQDTSRRQYELLKKIASAWEPDERRTCFLVGDPMQSVYLFRHADLALFNEVLKNGISSATRPVSFSELTLRRNFRSDAGIVNPLNAMFAEMSVQNHTKAREKSQFTPAVANSDTPDENAVHVRAQFTDDRTNADVQEAAWAIEAIRPHLSAIERARKNGDEYRVGVLVRARKHVTRIAAALRDAGIGYRAIELETLEECQEIRDLLSLLRALLSPVDRVAWLSILRAPWCGLSLRDLHMLSGNDDPALLKRPILTLLSTQIETLSEDGARRARRILQTMQLALSQRFSGQFGTSPSGLAAWVERTWRSLGGQHCVSADQYENVQAFFRLLSTITPDGLEASNALPMVRLERFFAQPTTEATEKTGVQLMTIHKAKGLGFEVVLVPGLDRRTGRDDHPLLQWMARTRHDSDERELLIAPIGPKGEETNPTYKWVKHHRENEEREELNRLLYVACTRARKELYLFGSLGVKNGQMREPSQSSLLATGWPYMKRIFQEQFAAQATADQAQAPFLMPPQQMEPGSGFQIAASRSGQLLHRLPTDWEWKAGDVGLSNPPRYPQDFRKYAHSITANGLRAQAVGIVVHALLQQIAALPAHDARRKVTVTASMSYWKDVAAALLRNAGLSSKDVATQTGRVTTLLQSAADDPTGNWILGQRQEARSESAWTFRETGASPGKARTVRADRVFIAGSEPLAKGETHLWIVDYKTTIEEDEGATLLLDERSKHQAQLAEYGRVLCDALDCKLPLRFALYYPALPRLDWWPE